MSLFRRKNSNTSKEDTSLNTSMSEHVLSHVKEQRELYDSRKLKKIFRAKDTKALRKYLSYYGLVLHFEKSELEAGSGLILTADGFQILETRIKDFTRCYSVYPSWERMHKITRNPVGFLHLRGYKVTIPEIREKIAKTVEDISQGKDPEDISGLTPIPRAYTEWEQELSKKKERTKLLDNTRENTRVRVSRDELIETHGIQTYFNNDNFPKEIVAFHLKGKSYLQFLREVQIVASQELNTIAINPEQLEKWEKDSAFRFSPNRIIVVQGYIEGTENMPHQRQIQCGFNDVELEDLAVAHAAYLVSTGQSIFGYGAVHAHRGVLCYSNYHKDGLRYSDNCMAAACRARSLND